MYVMSDFKKYSFVVFSIFSFHLNGQAIDESILSQLSPEQIEMAKDVYASSTSLDLETESLPTIEESLVKKDSNDDANTAPESDDSKNTPIRKFGYDFFLSMPTSLTAVGDLPLPNDYKISLRDQFRVSLSGSKDAIFNLNVKLDGSILFPELGSIYVAGQTFQEVKEKLTKLIEKSYIGVTIDISLQNLSAKKITIVGAVNTPGTYLVNPFTTITGALAYSGGISEIGSLRNIKLIRNNTEIFSFDLYDLLIKGDRSNDITIEAGDTLLINAANQFVEIKGGVKRPAIYEVLEGETFRNLVDFALGFKQTANKTKISASFLDLKESKIVMQNINDLDQSLVNTLSVDVFSYVNENIANIQVLGAVDQPGFYDLSKYRNLKDLIDNLRFVDVYPWVAVLEQFDENKIINSSILFSLNDPTTYNSIELLPNSRIYFANLDKRSFDVNKMSNSLIKDYSLTINYKQESLILPVYGSYSVSSFVDYLGLDMSDVNIKASYVSPLESIVVNDDFRNMEFVAQKYNTVSFRSPDNDLITVSVSGAIEFPGSYTLNDDATIEDLYQLVGDFKSQAYLDGIILTREAIRERQLKAIQKSREDLNKALLINSQKGEIVGDINIIRALSETIDPENLGRLAGNFAPNSQASINTVLFDGDSLIIPKNSNTINVLGEVLNPIAFEYSKKTSVRSAINMAGGYQQSADKKRVYVIKANGVIERAEKNIFVGNVALSPGDTIVVPRKFITNNPGLDALSPITQILSDIAFSAAALENLSSNN